MSTKRVAIKGGYRFKSFAGKPADEIRTVDPPEKALVVIPNNLVPSVAVGDTVKAGQIIARDDESISSPLHASISGSVTAVGQVDYLGTKKTAVTIEASGSDEITLLAGASEEWENLSVEALETLIYLSGASGLDTCGIPTRFRSSATSTDAVKDLVVNGVEADLFPVSTELLIKENGLRSFADGCKILAKIMPNAQLHVVMNRERSTLLSELADELPKAATYAVKSEYPAARDEMLVSSVLKRPFPFGFTAAHAGAIVVSARTVLHVIEAVTSGVPVIERILPVGGSGVQTPCHVRLRVGSPVAAALNAAGGTMPESRIVADSLLSGETVENSDTGIQRTWQGVFALPDGEPTEIMPFAQPGFRKDSYTNTFAAIALPWVSKRYDTNLRGDQRACLSCSYCAEVCPVGILPNLLHKYAEREIIDEELQRYKIFDCIDCNLCSYVCPSKIPVAALMKKGKKMLEAEGISDIPRIRAAFDLNDEGAQS